MPTAAGESAQSCQLTLARSLTRPPVPAATVRGVLTLAADQVTPAIRRAVELVCCRVGRHRLTAGRGWDVFARSCGLTDTASDTGVLFAVGDQQHVLGVLDRARVDDRVAFIMVGSVRPASAWRRWRRGTRHLDPTKALWRAGWSPLSVHRVDVPRGRSIVEVVIGDARPRPGSLLGRSAFDDAD